MGNSYMSVGHRMKEIARKMDIPTGRVAELMGVHIVTIYTWYGRSDLSTQIIRNFCDRVAQIDLREFFNLNEIPVASVSSEEFEILQAFKKFPEPVRIKFSRVMLGVLELVEESITASRNGR